MYEERIDSLHAQVESIYENVESDEILEAMRSDASTAAFAGPRMREIIVDTLKDEREGHITLLADELAKRNAECEFLRDEINKQKRELQVSLQNARRQKEREMEVEKRVRDEFEQMQKAKDAQAARIQELEASVAAVHKEKQAEKDDMRAALLKLTKLIAKQKQNIATSKLLDSMEDSFVLKAGSLNVEHSLETLLITLENSFESQVRSMQEADERFQTLRASQENAIARLQQSQDKLTEQVRGLHAREDELLKELESAKREAHAREAKLLDVSEELRQKEAAHASSEKERLEVRDQYLAIGEKLKEILDKEDRQTSAQVRTLEEEKRALELNLTESRRKLEDVANEVKSLREENEHLLRDTGSKRQIETLEQDLSAALHELAQAKRALDEIKTSAEQEKRRLEDSFRDERRRLETAKESALREKEVQIERHYEKLIREKEMSMRESERMAKVNLRAKKEEAARASEAINDRMLQLSKDYISRTQHEEVLGATRSRLEAQLSAQALELNERHGAELRTLEETLEKEAASQLSQASATLKDKIIRLEAELAREKKERLEAERCVDEERSKLVRSRHRCEQEERAKSAAMEQLSAATHVIDRLKSMAADLKGKLQASAKALKAEQEKFLRVSQQAEGKVAAEENLRFQMEERAALIKRQEKKIAALEAKARALETSLAEAKTALTQKTEQHVEELNRLTHEIALVRENEVQSTTNLAQEEESTAKLRAALKSMEKAKDAVVAELNQTRMATIRSQGNLQSRVMQGVQEVRSLRESLRLAKAETELQLQAYQAYTKQELSRISWKLTEELRKMQSRHQAELQVVNGQHTSKEREVRLEREREMQVQQANITRLEQELARTRSSGDAAQAERDKLVSSLKGDLEAKLERINALVLDNKRLTDNLKDVNRRLSEAEEAVKTREALLEEIKSQSTKQNKSYEELEKILETHLANFTSILMALSAEVDLPQELMDALLETDTLKFQSALRELASIVHGSLDSLSQSVQGEARKGADLLAAKNKELDAALVAQSKYKTELEQSMAEIKSLKASLEELGAREQDNLREKAEALEFVKNKSDAQLQQVTHQLEVTMSSHKEEKEELEKRHSRAITRLEERQRRESEDLKADFQRREEELSSQVKHEQARVSSLESELHAAQRNLDKEKEKAKAAQSELGASRELGQSFRSTLPRTRIGTSTGTTTTSHFTPTRGSWRANPTAESSPIRRTSRNVKDLRELLTRSMALDSELEAFSSQLSMSDFGTTGNGTEASEKKTNISFESGPLDLTLGDVQLKVESASNVTVEGANSFVTLSPKRGSGKSVRMSRLDL